VPPATKAERAAQLRKLAVKKGRKLFINHLMRELGGRTRTIGGN